jgi:hypothetical protein
MDGASQEVVPKETGDAEQMRRTRYGDVVGALYSKRLEIRGEGACRIALS